MAKALAPRRRAQLSASQTSGDRSRMTVAVDQHGSRACCASLRPYYTGSPKLECPSYQQTKRLTLIIGRCKNLVKRSLRESRPGVAVTTGADYDKAEKEP